MSNPGRLQATIKHYRDQLRAREAQAERALEEAYQHTLRTIQPALDKLHREMAAAMADGKKIPLHWLYEQNRLETLKKLITHEIDYYGAIAQMQTGQLQHMAVALGQDAAQALLQATVPAGVRYAFGVPSPAAIADLVGATQSGSPLADLFAGFGAEAAKGAEQALIAGLTNGDNPRKVAGAVQDALGVSRQRALTISQNEMVRAYRSSNAENFRANSDVLDGWIWVADLGSACLACTAMNGTEHSVDEDMASHVRCECVMCPKTKSWDDILGPLGIDTSDLGDTSINIPDGSEWFAKQDAAMQQSILGSKTRYQAYQNGVPLKDMVKHTHDPKWGGSIQIKPLRELVKR